MRLRFVGGTFSCPPAPPRLSNSHPVSVSERMRGPTVKRLKTDPKATTSVTPTVNTQHRRQPLPALADGPPPPPLAFVFFLDPPTTAKVERATTLSISLGPSMSDVVLPLLESLDHKPEGERPALYACENDHDAVHKLEDALKGALVRFCRCFAFASLPLLFVLVV